MKIDEVLAILADKEFCLNGIVAFQEAIEKWIGDALYDYEFYQLAIPTKDKQSTPLKLKIDTGKVDFEIFFLTTRDKPKNSLIRSRRSMMFLKYETLSPSHAKRLKAKKEA